MDLIIVIGGALHLGFAVFHLFFWKLFKWKPAKRSEYIAAINENKQMAVHSYINNAVMQILNLCLTFVFLVVAFISFFYSIELLTTKLGNIILLSVSIFWLLRLFEQLFFFGFEKIFSIVLTILFFTVFLIYLIPLIINY